MKTLKTTLIALLATFTFSIANASTPNTNEKLTLRYAITAYVDAFAHGQIQNLTEVIDDSAKFSQTRGQKVCFFSKDQILQGLKNQQNVEQNCTTHVDLVENTYALVVYKVEMRYPTFSRFSYVTMADTGNGWKITNVATVFS